ncbi:alpha/beta hydrolase family protein [Sphingobium sp. B11D3D]|uniref:alpha/beta hydrolase family protein n=1 Tax=Sphingobium sp. B11D3D TaxID=2940576 RepID=UPI002224CFDF|nr:S9 family peptidase [Sphingobium sp. B11D3D]MCW2369081.1 dipeptidyl aminopeptidase/acylaminoacyl peptidase [Sphingobium sp. B11D3D]
MEDIRVSRARVAARIVVAAALLSGLWTPPAVSQTPPPPVAANSQITTEAFAALPFFEMPELSPDGEHIAGLLATSGKQVIAIMPLTGDRSNMIRLNVPDLMDVSAIRWVGNDNIVVNVIALAPIEGENWYLSRLIAVNRTSGKATQLLWEMGGQNAGDILWVPSDDSTRILVAAQNSPYLGDPDFWSAVYSVDVTTGKKSLVEKSRRFVSEWGADAQGRVRIGIGYNDQTTKSSLLFRGQAENGLRTIDTANLSVDEYLTVPFYFVPGTDHGYVFEANDKGVTSIVERNLITGKIARTVFDDAPVDSVILDKQTSALLGVVTNDRAAPVRWLDPALQAHQNDLQKASPGSTVDILSFNSDHSRLLVKFSTPDNPGLLYVLDAPSNTLAKLAVVNPRIESKRLSRATYVEYKARDGLQIEGVLTMPRGRPDKNLPFIVMPHGGPWAHDRLTYDYWVQFLAERGYAVLQPNFRGSTGYGEAFLKAGEGQMGLAMQDDVTDGVMWAVKQGIADPKRVCIVGASYGGYAAMWGIAKDPDLYRCAISVSGVSNVRRDVNDFGGSTRARLFKGQWQRMAADFEAISPYNAVGRIKTPLLLIHGKKDVRVDHNQSTRMHAAMTKAGKSVEMVSVPLADHYFTREADRLTLLRAMEDFLAKHNPAD